MLRFRSHANLNSWDIFTPAYSRVRSWCAASNPLPASPREIRSDLNAIVDRHHHRFRRFIGLIRFQTMGYGKKSVGIRSNKFTPFAIIIIIIHRSILTGIWSFCNSRYDAKKSLTNLMKLLRFQEILVRPGRVNKNHIAIALFSPKN